MTTGGKTGEIVGGATGRIGSLSPGTTGGITAPAAPAGDEDGCP